MDVKKSRLYKYILSDINIFNAIYALESYVYERGLLCDDDITSYYRLTDKFDFVYISSIISECQEKLIKILTDDSELFEVQVYLKLKKYNEETGVEYRPIHTARLIDQICMVSLLNAIVYETNLSVTQIDIHESEENKKDFIIKNTNRKLSGLAKLLPSNFFGNIPSTQPEKLFSDWKPKYKEYSDSVIDKYYEYSQSNKYSHEICLDIKRFYPNIDPKHIFDFIINKLSIEFKDADDFQCLHAVVTKLLYFKLSNMNCDWADAYYDDTQSRSLYYTRGIPQGLPQSYFFGNICMIEIAQCVEKFYSGDAFYYVDDSVVYTNNSADKINEINKAIKEIDWSKGGKYKLFLTQQLHNKYDYSIKIHPNGDKSSITPISEAYNGLNSLKALAGLTSNINSAIYLSIDEIEDMSTEKKIKAIITAIDDEKINITKGKRANSDKEETEKTSTGNEERKSIKYKLRLLNRYRKFFLFRLKLIEIRDSDSNNLIEDFNIKYPLSQYGVNLSLKVFFNKYDEDIFQEELRLLLSIMNPESDELSDILTKIKNFDYRIAGRGKKENSSSILYLSKDIDGAISISKQKKQKYKSLQVWAESQFKQSTKIKSERLREKLLNSIVDGLNNSIFQQAEYAKQTFDSSNEYKRSLTNAIISQILNVPITDDLAIYKRDNRTIKYYELRLLLFARNRLFKYENFNILASNILAEPNTSIDEEAVDYKLVPALHIFIAKVKDPEKVDSLILIHRMVNGLWKNGSKFLHFYTLHNEEHSIELIRNVVRLVNTVDYFSLKGLDYYILFLACYLHDISMVIHPDLEMFCKENSESDKIYSDFIEKLCDDNNPLINKSKPDIKLFILDYFKSIFEYFENSVRSVHAKKSATFIVDRCNTPYFKFIDNAILQVVAEVAESHGYESEEVYGRKSFARTKIYSQKYMMILIRLADLLDLSKDRVSYYIMKENIKHMSEVSQFHWISHYITDKCEVHAKFEPLYSIDSSKKQNKEPLENGSIIERICFDIYLNIKQMTQVVSSGGGNWKYCKHIQCTHKPNENLLSIKILEDSNENTPCKECAFVCKWATRKHEYLFSELNALLKYLNSVNKSLFKTEIDVNIYYENKQDLDSEFSDIIGNYIMKSEI